MALGAKFGLWQIRPGSKQSIDLKGDITTYPFEKAGEKLQSTKKIAEYEVQFIVGALSVSSWVGALSLMGVDVFQFAVENKDNFSRWSEIVKVCLKTRKDLIPLDQSSILRKGNDVV